MAKCSHRRRFVLPASIYRFVSPTGLKKTSSSSSYFFSLFLLCMTLVADLYITLLDAIVENPEKVGHGREGFYFAESGEHRWYDISKEVSRVLVELGRGKSDEPTAFTREELPKYFLSEVRCITTYPYR